MYFHSLCLFRQKQTCCSQVKAGCNHEFRDGLHSLIQTRKEDCYIIIKPNGCPGIVAGEYVCRYYCVCGPLLSHARCASLILNSECLLEMHLIWGCLGWFRRMMLMLHVENMRTWSSTLLFCYFSIRRRWRDSKTNKRWCVHWVLSCTVYTTPCICVCVCLYPTCATPASYDALPVRSLISFLLCYFFKAEHILTTHIDLFARAWIHLAQQQGSIWILACSLWFITVHNGRGTTQNTAEVRVLPYGVRRGNEQPYGSTGQGLNTGLWK